MTLFDQSLFGEAKPDVTSELVVVLITSEFWNMFFTDYIYCLHTKN